MSEELEKALLGFGTLRDWTDEAVIRQRLQQHANGPVTLEQTKAAVETLIARGLAERQASGRTRLCEPDCQETDLYLQLENELQRPAILDKLGVKERRVFQNTSQGGPRDGRLSRPDFTLAEIRSWRFDPQATLEVYSFEIKNRSGAKTSAVYEAVAHGRLVHHCYLICPRSTLYPEETDELRRLCAAQGVGLGVFDLVLQDGQHLVKNLDIELVAQRRTPAPAAVQRHLTNRLNEDNANRLEHFARGAR